MALEDDMKTFKKNIMALGLSALALTSIANASTEKTIYLNNKENINSEIQDLFNRDSDATNAFVTSNKALVDNLVGGVLIAENSGKHYYDTEVDMTSLNIDTRIIGGQDSVMVEDKEHNRIHGQTRYETSVEVAEALGTDRDLVLCSGTDYADALPATSLAAFEDRNILLLGPDFIPEETRAYLENYGKGKNILAIGGSDTIGEDLLDQVREITGSDIGRIAGQTRHDTSLEVAKRFGDTSSLVLISGNLSESGFLAAIYAAKNNRPLIVIDKEDGSGIESIENFGARYIYLLTEHNENYKEILENYKLKSLRDEDLSLEDIYPSEVHLSEAEETEEEKVYKQTGAEAEAKEWIAQRESNGSYTAYNPRGGYYGRYQLNPTLIHYGASPAEQEAAADRYVEGRYGTWVNAKAFWMNNGWY